MHEYVLTPADRAALFHRYGLDKAGHRLESKLRGLDIQAAVDLAFEGLSKVATGYSIALGVSYRVALSDADKSGRGMTID